MISVIFRLQLVVQMFVLEVSYSELEITTPPLLLTMLPHSMLLINYRVHQQNSAAMHSLLLATFQLTSFFVIDQWQKSSHQVRDKLVSDAHYQEMPGVNCWCQALHPSRVAKSSTSFGWGKGGKVTAAGWQVTLCDPIWHWHVISHSLHELEWPDKKTERVRLCILVDLWCSLCIVAMTSVDMNYLQYSTDFVWDANYCCISCCYIRL